MTGTEPSLAVAGSERGGETQTGSCNQPGGGGRRGREEDMSMEFLTGTVG